MAEAPALTTETFPYDLDTTSIGLTVTHADDQTARLVMNEILQYRNEDGIVMVSPFADPLFNICILNSEPLQTYFDHGRPRIDPVVCVNVLSLFYSHGRGSELRPTLEWVHGVLQHRAYLDGTRYYETAECFLYFVSRLLESTDDEKLHAKLKPVLKERLRERIGAAGDALALAMRVLACATVGVRDELDMRLLLRLQSEDGGWEAGWVYKYGSSGVKIGNRGLTTAMAINAIESLDTVKDSDVSTLMLTTAAPLPAAPLPAASLPRRKAPPAPIQILKRPHSGTITPVSPVSPTSSEASRRSFKENVRSVFKVVKLFNRNSKRPRTTAVM